MAADRKVPAPSNTPGGDITGTDFMEDVLAEVQGLWRHAQVPLSGVAGSNNITASCDVALDVRNKGNKFTFTPFAANTAAVVLEINGKGVLPLRDRSGAELAGGRLSPGRAETVEDFGSEYRLMTDPPATGVPLLHALFAYQLAAGSNGGATAAGWNKYPLNTVIHNDIPGLAFNAGANQLTLPARTYDWVEADAYYADDDATLCLWNVSDNQMISGMARRAGYNYGSVRTLGRFTLATPKTCELRLYATIASGSTSLGRAVGITSPSSIPEQFGFLALRSFAT